MDTDYIMMEYDANAVIGDALFISSFSIYDTDFLQKKGIDNVIDLSGMYNPYLKNLNYMKIDLHDNSSANIGQYFFPAIEFIEEVRKNNQRVLVNCYAGISRSASIIIAYLIYRGISLNDSVKFLREKRNIIQPNAGFLKQLKKFEMFIRKGK